MGTAQWGRKKLKLNVGQKLGDGLVNLTNSSISLVVYHYTGKWAKTVQSDVMVFFYFRFSLY